MAIKQPTDDEKKLMDLLKMPAGSTDFDGTFKRAVGELAGRGTVGSFDKARIEDMLERGNKECSMEERLQSYAKILQQVQQPLMYQLGVGRDPAAGLEEAMMKGQQVWQLYMKE